MVIIIEFSKKKNRLMGIMAIVLGCLLTGRVLLRAVEDKSERSASEHRGVYFAKKKYVDEPLPGYAESKDKLPAPILDANPGWVRMYWKCWEIAFEHFKRPPEGSGLVSNFLDEAFSPNIFQWDTIFMVMFARYQHHIFPAIQSLDNFYCGQHRNGYICREIKEVDGEDFVYIGREHTINPPLFSWAEVESFKVTGDKSRLAMVLPVLEKYAEWLETGRKKPQAKHKLYWNTPFGSGMDNTPRKGSGWVDMSAQMVIQYNDIATICDVLAKPEKAKRFRARAKAISEKVNRWMWNKNDGLYYDVDDNGNQVKWKTAACFWPMLAGIASKEQAGQLVENLRDPKTFWRPFVFPTLAADQIGYHPKGDYWKGGVWAPTNLAIIKGLEKYGYEDFAAEATEKYLAGMYEVFEKTGTVWENYAPEVFEPGNRSKPDFVGWTGCGPIGLLIENVLGLRCDGVNSRLLWRLRRTDRHGMQKLRVGNITVSVICAERPAADSPAEITVEADRAFELVVIHSSGKKIFKLGMGKHNFKVE